MNRDDWLFLGVGVALLILGIVLVCGLLFLLYAFLAWGFGSILGLFVGSFTHAYHLLAS